MRPPFAGTPTGRELARRLPGILDELIGVERLLDRLPGLGLNGEVELYVFEFRGPVSLPVAWD
jgi:hypothetical protein